MKAGSFRKDAAWVYAGYFLRYLSLIVLIPYYGRVLGPTAYGKVLAAMSLMNLVWMAVNYGFSTTGTRELASAKDAGERSRIFGQQMLARLLLIPAGVILGVSGTLLSPVLAANIGFGVLATIQGMLAAFNLGWFFQGVRQFRVSIAVEALSYPLNLAFVLLLVRNANDGENVLVSQILASLVCLSLAYALSRKSARLTFVRLSAGIKEIKDSTVIFITSISPMIMTSGSAYLLSLLSTSTEVGYFGTAERFASLGLSLLIPAAQVLMPTISNLHMDAAHKAFALARKGLMMELGYGVTVVIAGTLMTPFVLPVIMGPKFAPSVPVLQILACMFPFAAFTHAMGLYVVIPLRKEKILILTTTLGLIVNLIVAVVAVRLWGACGMAVARVCGEAATALILLAIATRMGMMKDLLRHRSQ